MGYRGLRSGLAASVAIYAVAGAAPAQAQTKTFNVPAQAATTGIPELARQADIQILVSNTAVRGKAIRAVKGKMTVDRALRTALKGTGLNFSSNDGRTFILSGGQEAASAEGDAEDEASVGARPEILVIGTRNWTLNTDIKRTRDDAQPYVVFDREQIKRSGATNLEDFIRDNLNAATGSSMTTQESNPGAPSGGINLRGLGTDETLILVDGRRIAPTNTGVTEVIGQPQLNGIPLGAIERIEVLASSASGIYGSNATGGVVNIILKRDYKGLELTGTYGATFNGSAQNRRIDLSAGTNLFGGSTNVMVTGSYQKTDPLYLGDEGYLLGYMNRVLANSPTAVPLGTTPNIRSTTNVNLVLDPAYGGTSIGSSFTSVPVGYRGVAVDGVAGLVANAGKFNLNPAPTAQPDRALQRQILNGSELISGSIAINQKVTSWLKLFAEASGSQNRGTSTYSSVLGQTITLAAAAPNNPFQQAVTVNFPILNVPMVSKTKTQTLRAAGGAILTLPHGWSGSADYTYNKTWYDRDQPRMVAQTQITQFGNGGIDILRDLTINPIDYQLTDLGSFSTDNQAKATTAALRLAGPLPFRLPGGKPSLTIQAQRAETSLSGSVSYVVTGGTFSATYTPPRSIKSDSAYFEARIPLIGEGNDIPFVRALEFQVAGRYEKYDVTGPSGQVKCSINPGGATATARLTAPHSLTEADLSIPCPNPAFDVLTPYGISSRGSFNPTYSVKWTLAKDLVLRGSFATGYRPPDANLLVPVSANNLFTTKDPARGNELIGTPISPLFPTLRTLPGLTLGNPNLRPEHSTSYTGGFILTPQIIPNLRLSADWSYTKKRDNYFVPAGLALAGSSPLLQTIFNDFITLYPERFTRNTDPASFGAFTVGPITFADLSVINASGSKTGSVDFAADYETKAFGGRLDFAASATWLYIAKVQITANTPFLDYKGVGGFISQAGGPEWRGQAEMRYSNDRWSLGLRGRYVDGYWFSPDHTVNASSATTRVVSQTYFDLFGSVKLFRRTELSAGARNLFNKAAPFDGSSYGYSGLGDPRRGTFYMSVNQKF